MIRMNPERYNLSLSLHIQNTKAETETQEARKPKNARLLFHMIKHEK